LAIEELTSQELIDRGRAARRLLEDEMILTLFDDLTDDMFTHFMATSATEDNERTKLWAMCQAMGKIKTRLDGYIEVGKLEERNNELDKQNGR
jgi:hypothetical protein